MKNMIKNFRDKQSIKRIEKLCNNLGLKFFERTSGMINVYFVNRDGMYITVISDSDPLVVYRHIVQIQIHYGVLLKYNKCKDANILLFGACWDYKPFMDKICNMIANNLQSSEYAIYCTTQQCPEAAYLGKLIQQFHRALHLTGLFISHRNH